MSDGTKIAIGIGVVGVAALFLLRGGGGGAAALLGGSPLGGVDALGVAPGTTPPVTSSSSGSGIGSKILSFGGTAAKQLLNPLTPIKLTAQVTQTSAHYTAAAVSGAVGAVKGVAGSIASGASSVFHSIF